MEAASSGWTTKPLGAMQCEARNVSEVRPGKSLSPRKEEWRGAAEKRSERGEKE